MKQILLLALFLLLVFSRGKVSAQSSAPKLLPFQGRLTDQNGVAVSNGVRLVQFKIFEVPTSGSPVWAGELHRTTVNGGLVNVLLGSKTPLNGLDFNRQLYLEITVDINSDNTITAADPPMLPRQAILPVIFAKEAADSRKLNGSDWTPIFGANNPNLPIPASKLADASLPAAKIQPGTITSNQIAAETINASLIAAATISSNQIADAAIHDRHIGVLSKLSASDGSPGAAVVVDTFGRVGIGTNSPQAQLDIAGTLQIAAMAQQSIGSNGYVKIGELIIQWGQEMTERDIANGEKTSQNFPMPFPNQVLLVVAGMNNAPGGGFCAMMAVESTTKTNVTFVWNELCNTAQKLRASYIAIGRWTDTFFTQSAATPA